MRSIYNGIARLTIRDSFRLDENHVRDLFHALASVRCAEMVTPDGHWAGQVSKLRLSVDFVRVYSEVDFEQVLVDLRTKCRLSRDALQLVRASKAVARGLGLPLLNRPSTLVGSPL